MKKPAATILLFFICFSLRAQVKDTLVLNEVSIKAYEHNSRGSDIAAPVAIIGKAQIEKFNNNSLVSAINTIAGVRMEERSPGSYRLNIRGSSLRSPFGVRNVKVYWNGIPFTDPGGNTYLNQLSTDNISSIEILKGPGSSLYGAGTGGVLLAESFSDKEKNNVTAAYTFGSFGYHHFNIEAVVGDEHFKNKLQYNVQDGDGYRQQSAMKKTTLSWEALSRINEKSILAAHVLYGDLYYQTPGGLTKAQYNANPVQARPAAGGFPSAIQNKAAIYQKTIWAGVQQQYQFNSHWKNSTGIYIAYTQLKNPSIRNYEKRNEPHFGGRTFFSFEKKIGSSKLKIIGGAEAQQGYFNVNVYKNKSGNADSLQTADDINSSQWNIFSQAELALQNGWTFTTGISINKSTVAINRTSLIPNFNFNSNYNNEWSPRIAVIKSINNNIKLYSVVSKGFSPPTTAELLPSTSIINTSLQAEHGLNYELGLRMNALQQKIQMQVNTYYFILKNAIVQRRDAGGADYFSNAGGTQQKGVETSASYIAIHSIKKAISHLQFNVSYTYAHYRYDDFKQGSNNFSGKQLPGISPNTITAGADIILKPGMYFNLNYFYSDRIFLNDANTDKASSYNLLTAKMGYKKAVAKKWMIEIFAGADNILNQTYSLGNDINAAAGRNYNAAAKINYNGGVIVTWLTKGKL